MDVWWTLRVPCFLALAVSSWAIDSVGSGAVGDKQPQFPSGDVRRCTALDQKPIRFEVLPGGGWDNLRNKDQGMVVMYNYSGCLTTDDGKYLLPDGIHTLPIKSSRVETFAELFSHWSNYTSTLSKSINVHAGLHLPHVGISASFSDEHENVKSHQYFDKTVTTRIQVRYVRYQALLQPDTPLHPVFRERLQKIAALIALNKTESARYESQLVVRDFGTHVITSVDVGAALAQLDQININYMKKSEFTKNTVLASAGASFFSVFDFGADYKQTSTHTQIDEYNKNRQSSKVLTFGGPNYRPTNFSANDWIVGLDENLVALDRSGDPIYYTITGATLPDVPLSVVHQVYEQVKEAVEQYYKHNTYPGCTKEDSPNFSFQANYDDGTCIPVNTNFTFGGVYQTCTSRGYTDLCGSMAQKNPKTGGYSCPSGYDSILLQEGTKSSSDSRRECHSCWIFFHCCKQKTYYASASYSAYWCAAKTETVSQNSGFLFGGLFTSSVANPMTRTLSCPDKFYSLNILADMTVCVSDDYELGYKYSLPFAGFYSCKAGNPLVLHKNLQLQHASSTGERTLTLASFMSSSGPTAYPHRCPKGYSQHLALVDHGCEINYCVKSGALSAQSFPRVQRPPFMPRPSDFEDKYEDGMALNADGSVWMSLEEEQNQAKSGGNSFKGLQSAQPSSGGRSSPSSSGGDDLPPGAIVAISVVSTVVCVVATLLVVRVYRNRRRRGSSSSPSSRLRSPFSSGEPSYSSTDGTDAEWPRAVVTRT